MWLRFVNEYCGNVKYIFSVDDDTIINLWEVIKDLEFYLNSGISEKEVEQTIFCYVLYHSKVNRDPKHRW